MKGLSVSDDMEAVPMRTNLNMHCHWSSGTVASNCDPVLAAKATAGSAAA